MKTVKSSQKTFPTTLFILACILAFAGIMRVYQLATLPATLNRDEAALAYNALLLQQAGKDEWGRAWPIALESFGDYKLPGYPYILVIFFQLFGVNDFAVRLPSALAGTILVGLSYIFARRVLLLESVTSLLVAAGVAIQPVFFFYSRMAWEANVGLMFFVTGVICFLSPTDTAKQLFSRKDVLGLLFCLLAILTYNTPLLLLPFLGVAIMLRRGLKQWKSWRVAVSGLAILFLVGIVTFSSISQQKSSITIFNDETNWRESVIYYESFSGLQQKLFGNRYVFYAKVIIEQYVESWSPLFLIQKGGSHPWHNLPGKGHLLVMSYGFGLISLVRLLWLSINPNTDRSQRPIIWAVLFLLLTSLFPSVITVDAPHATRSLFFFFMLCVTGGISLEWMWHIVSRENDNKRALQTIYSLMILFAVLNQSYVYYSYYFSKYPTESAVILKAGLNTAVAKVENELRDKDDQVAVVDPDGFWYVTVAWGMKMPADQFFATVNHHLPDRIGLKYGYRVGRYRFIVDRDDRVEEDKKIIEWSSPTKQWVINNNL